MCLFIYVLSIFDFVNLIMPYRACGLLFSIGKQASTVQLYPVLTKVSMYADQCVWCNDGHVIGNFYQLWH